MKTVFDYSRLRGRIKEKCWTEGEFAKKIGICRTSLCKRLNNQIDFTQDEILRGCRVLDIGDSDIPTYFFTEKV